MAASTQNITENIWLPGILKRTSRVKILILFKTPTALKTRQ